MRTPRIKAGVNNENNTSKCPHKPRTKPLMLICRPGVPSLLPTACCSARVAGEDGRGRGPGGMMHQGQPQLRWHQEAPKRGPHVPAMVGMGLLACCCLSHLIRVRQVIGSTFTIPRGSPAAGCLCKSWFCWLRWTSPSWFFEGLLSSLSTEMFPPPLRTVSWGIFCPHPSIAPCSGWYFECPD